VKPLRDLKQITLSLFAPPIKKNIFLKTSLESPKMSEAPIPIKMTLSLQPQLLATSTKKKYFFDNFGCEPQNG
jgi:hypothetical protein